MLDKTALSPFDQGLNDAIIEITNRLVGPFKVSNDAPGTFRELKAHLDTGKRVVVAREGSEQTIFGDPEVNYAFRAWHDWCHWKGGYDFSIEGEMATCNMQIEQLYAIFGVSETTKRWSRYIIAEVIGQRRYYERYREYLSDQRAFVTAYMHDPTQALQRKW